jgi:hypothetical protein
MSMMPASRATLADVILLISRADFPDRRKEELRSAVRTVARLLGSEPAAIAADPAALRRRLETIAPEAHGISRGRWANVRSLLGKALAMARPIMPGRSRQAILPSWVALERPSKRETYLLPWSAFPPSFKDDVDLQRLSGQDLSAMDRRAPRDRRRCESALTSSGWPLRACDLVAMLSPSMTFG